MNLDLKKCNSFFVCFFKITERFNIRMETIGERLNELKDISIEMIQAEEQRKKCWKVNEHNL